MGGGTFADCTKRTNITLSSNLKGQGFDLAFLRSFPLPLEILVINMYNYGVDR